MAETITGEVVSVWCYLQNRQNVGRTGALCALADLKWEGNPPGLLAADGALYQLAGPIVEGNNAKLVPYIGRQVIVRGEVSRVDGIRVLTADTFSSPTPNP